MKQERDFFDKFQPDYLFVQLFGLDSGVSLVKLDIEKFRRNMFFLMLFLVLMRFFMMEVIPSFLGIILTVIVYYLVLILILGYIKWINKMTKSSGFFGILLSVGILVLLVLVV